MTTRGRDRLPVASPLDDGVLIHVGNLPDGRAVYRPLTLPARPEVSRKPPAVHAWAVTPKPRSGPPGWFWAGILAIVALALGFALWLLYATLAGASGPRLIVGALMALSLMAGGVKIVYQRQSA